MCRAVNLHLFSPEPRCAATPLAEDLLSDKDWARIDAACAAASVQPSGADEDEEMRQLFRRIIGPAPAPSDKGLSELHA